MRIRSLAMFANSLNHLCHKHVIIQQYLIDNFQLTDIHIVYSVQSCHSLLFIRFNKYVKEINTLKILSSESKESLII